MYPYEIMTKYQSAAPKQQMQLSGFQRLNRIQSRRLMWILGSAISLAYVYGEFVDPWMNPSDVSKADVADQPHLYSDRLPDHLKKAYDRQLRAVRPNGTPLENIIDGKWTRMNATIVVEENTHI